MNNPIDKWMGDFNMVIRTDAYEALQDLFASSRCLYQIQEPEADIWPCVNIDVDASGKITNAKLYSPGLPAGNHDVYPVRVPYMDEHTEAWRACVDELEKAVPGFMSLGNMNGIECAVAAIRGLSERAKHQELAAAEQAAWHAGLDEGRTQATSSVSNATFQAAPAAAAVTESLQWTEPAPPSDACRYDHVTAQSPLGEFRIEWKSWKESDDYCLYLDGDFLAPLYELEDAKAHALQHLGDMAKKLSAYTLAATPAADAPVVLPEPDFQLKWNEVDECGTVKRPNIGETDCYTADTVRALLATATGLPAQAFQQRVQPWMMACFGPEISADTRERNHRFLEEALELVQCLGCTASEAHQLVDYVYGRPWGEPAQEVGGVMVTLAALCQASRLDMHACGETELARIWTKVEAIRAKQAAKPKHSPLPMHVPELQADAQDADGLYYLQDARWSAMVGNCPSFWRLGGGYTTSLDDAERFTLEAAMKQHKCRETDLPWLCSELDKLRRPTVDSQYMPRSWDAQRESIAAIAAAKGQA